MSNHAIGPLKAVVLKTRMNHSARFLQSKCKSGASSFPDIVARVVANTCVATVGRALNAGVIDENALSAPEGVFHREQIDFSRVPSYVFAICARFILQNSVLHIPYSVKQRMYTCITLSIHVISYYIEIENYFSTAGIHLCEEIYFALSVKKTKKKNKFSRQKLRALMRRAMHCRYVCLVYMAYDVL